MSVSYFRALYTTGKGKGGRLERVCIASVFVESNFLTLSTYDYFTVDFRKNIFFYVINSCSGILANFLVFPVKTN